MGDPLVATAFEALQQRHRCLLIAPGGPPPKGGSGRRSTTGQEEPWRGWRRSGDRTILFSNIDTSFYLYFNFHFLDLTILQPVTILTV